MKKLIDYYNRLLNKKLPDSTIDDDELADLYFELVETDAYYAGLITTSIENDLANKKEYDFNHLKKLHTMLESIEVKDLSEEDESIFQECMNYLKLLEELQNIIDICN